VPLFQQRQAELALSQSVLAESMVTLEALEQMLYRYADELMDIACEQRTVDRATRAKLFAWRAYIARRAREVVDNLVDLAGARSIFDNDPLQRFWRDVHVMGQHAALNHEAGMRNYGRVLMGLDPDVAVY
jgi:alkylation response protein AidB-like acyl-CoA dehydrogenase